MQMHTLKLKSCPMNASPISPELRLFLLEMARMIVDAPDELDDLFGSLTTDTLSPLMAKCIALKLYFRLAAYPLSPRKVKAKLAKPMSEVVEHSPLREVLFLDRIESKLQFHPSVTEEAKRAIADTWDSVI
ncbi:hypothetical protein DTL21_05405 [Bremerella cremea]|uniref:Uncharacterized protein n=2 Tax=Pirellulales TaxID=2691354 RepID=A0A2S8FZD9_9BACT|nr:hypothetical protein C5Y83_05405 [Blastopirellula marina]RCS49768.1 hypothetical protein DTL21_05405 [Bremerella cremea]